MIDPGTRPDAGGLVTRGTVGTGGHVIGGFAGGHAAVVASGAGAARYSGVVELGTAKSLRGVAGVTRGICRNVLRSLKDIAHC